jgi:hypothetical protein
MVSFGIVLSNDFATQHGNSECTPLPPSSVSFSLSPWYHSIPPTDARSVALRSRDDGQVNGATVDRGRVDLLAGLVDLLVDLVELEALGDDLGGLVLEGDFVLVDA